jgi:hypothetical protein
MHQADGSILQRVRELTDPIFSAARTPITEFYFSENEWHTGSIDLEEVYILIGREYARTASDDDIRSTFGHELGHAVTPAYKRSVYNAEDHAKGFITVGMACAFLAAGALLGNAREAAHFLSGRALGSMGIGTAAALVGRYQSRQWEFQADAIGAALTSPQQQLTNLQNLEKMSVQPSWTPLSTHPPITDRIAALAQLENTPEGAACLGMLRDTYCR